jgi:mRNA-degrading endonuclease RelE of RelBE toxin-antitoxin system
MNYELEFKESALKELRKLDKSIRELFKKRLAESLAAPRSGDNHSPAFSIDHSTRRA